LKSNDPKYQSPSFISLPVYNNRKVVAVMNLANKEHGGLFTESDERILAIMLGTIGMGMENISLHNKIKRLAEKRINRRTEKNVSFRRLGSFF